MEVLPLGPCGEDITWPAQVAPRRRKASSTRKIKPQTSSLRTKAFSTTTAPEPTTIYPPDEKAYKD